MKCGVVEVRVILFLYRKGDDMYHYSYYRSSRQYKFCLLFNHPDDSNFIVLGEMTDLLDMKLQTSK